MPPLSLRTISVLKNYSNQDISPPIGADADAPWLNTHGVCVNFFHLFFI